MWTKDVLTRFDRLTTNNKRIKIHLMPNVGHWLHAEDLTGMYRLINKESGL